MPLSTREAFGLFQAEVARIGNQAEMLRVGLAGYQQSLQENDQLMDQNKQLTERLAKYEGPGQGAGPAGAPSALTVPFTPRV
jgi:hypothetical protein